MQGRPGCPTCHGAGYIIRWPGFIRCACTRQSKAATDSLRRANARDDQPQQLTVDDMIRMGTSERRA